MEPIYKGHMACIKVVLNSEITVQWNLSIKDTWLVSRLSLIQR